MMNHAGGGMWVWTVIGILEVVLLVVVIIKLPQKISQRTALLRNELITMKGHLCWSNYPLTKP